MGKICRYGFGVDVTSGFEATLETLEKKLNKRGFNITTRLRMDELLCDSLRENFGRYIILGTCNPAYAGVLFNTDPNIGLVMPCNVIVYELPEGGCKVMIKDPARVMDLFDSPVVIEASMQIKEQLEAIAEEMGRR